MTERPTAYILATDTDVNTWNEQLLLIHNCLIEKAKNWLNWGNISLTKSWRSPNFVLIINSGPRHIHSLLCGYFVYITVYMHVLVNLMHKSNSVLSWIGWNYINPYIRRGDRDLLFQKKWTFCLTFVVSALGYQVQTISQFLNYISSYVWQRWQISPK